MSDLPGGTVPEDDAVDHTQRTPDDASAPSTDAAEASDEATTSEESEPTLVDMLVYGPIDALFALLRDPRGSATRGQARVDQALRQARALGELTVRFGSRELRRRTEAMGSDAEDAADTAPAPRRASGPAPDDVIADYDALSASQIIPLLAGLDPAERGRVADYEREARARQTILRRIAQLDENGA